MNEDSRAKGKEADNASAEVTSEPMSFRPISEDLLIEPLKSVYGLGGLALPNDGGTIDNVKNKLKATFISRGLQSELNGLLVRHRSNFGFRPTSRSEIRVLFAEKGRGKNGEAAKLAWLLSEGRPGAVEWELAGFLGDYEITFHKCFGTNNLWEEGLYPSRERGPITKDGTVYAPHSEHEIRDLDRCPTVVRSFEDIWESGIISEGERRLLVARAEQMARDKKDIGIASAMKGKSQGGS